MQFAIYFERESFSDHLTVEQWHAALASVDGVRRVASDSGAPDDWLGYFVNPRGTPGQQFHDRPDRVHDAEVYFPDRDKWHRAFYWHHSIGDFSGGVVTFESRDLDSTSLLTDPVHLASIALANELNAKLVNEDETSYES